MIELVHEFENHHGGARIHGFDLFRVVETFGIECRFDYDLVLDKEVEVPGCETLMLIYYEHCGVDKILVTDGKKYSLCVVISMAGFGPSTGKFNATLVKLIKNEWFAPCLNQVKEVIGKYFDV